jgi:hypothetical protein
VSKESVIDFPCNFPIKIMGRDTPEFRATARSLVESHVGQVSDDAVREAVSRNGSFVSITVTVTATSQQQLDAIYRDVSDHTDVLMAL